MTNLKFLIFTLRSSSATATENGSNKISKETKDWSRLGEASRSQVRVIAKASPELKRESKKHWKGAKIKFDILINSYQINNEKKLILEI